ncbi:MAG: hypothetical protein Q9188_005982 [Gyalolechia gomerana]
MENSRPFTVSLPQEESDWEYEYDETETESFYVTVDVSSSSLHTRAPKRDPQPEGTDAAPPNEHQQQEAENREALSVDPAFRNHDPSSSADALDRIQILDLHTPNPLISYNNRIYACSWGSTIGTDIFLTSPTALSAIPPETQITPLKTLPKVSILGTSCIQLTARPVTITPKTDIPQTQAHPQTPPADTQPPVPSTNDSGDAPAQPPPSTSPKPTLEQPYPPYPFKIPLNATAPNSTRKQASFLESLQAIKAAKGETDRVTVHSTKSHQSYGWRARRRLEEMAEAMDLEEQGGEDAHMGASDPSQSTNAVDEQCPSSQKATPSPAKRARTRARGHGRSPRRMGRPRGSKSRSVVRTGGVSGDHVTGAGNEARLDHSSADRTPARWKEIGKEVSEPVDGSGSKRLEGAGTAPAGHVEKADSVQVERDVDVVMGEGE